MSYPVGQDPAPQSAFAPVIERFGVPLMWLGVGYLLRMMTERPKRVTV